MMTLPHPLEQLSKAEFVAARDAVANLHGPKVALFFGAIWLEEPPRAEMAAFLAAEHDGATLAGLRPRRQARVEYDIIQTDRYEHMRAVVDVTATGEIVSNEAFEHTSQPCYTPGQFAQFQGACVRSQMFKDAMAEFSLPEGFRVAIDPWPYGGLDESESPPRYMQGLMFARDSSAGNPDSNHYGYPIPIIPVMDWRTKEIVRVDRLATGGKEDGLAPEPRKDTPKKLFQKRHMAEYVPELLNQPLRSDLKPLNVVQPEGASFTVRADGLVEWQKWRFRLGFTPREGAILHDVCYQNRSIVYRLSYSELTVPYADPRPPYHRKNAFDLGDNGIGHAANNLQLGCDCLGAIHYADSCFAAPDGTPSEAKSVMCVHEQDNGILWKHTNFRTGRAVVVRSRELVVQFIATLENYEYIFAYKLDLAGGITVETRATGIMSVVAIDDDKTSKYGNVVAPGVLAQNHQHLFALRIDPAMDSYGLGDTQITVEESARRAMNPNDNPFGNFYEVEQTVVDHAMHLDAEPRLNRTLKLENTVKHNTISGRNVGYKLVLPASQLLLADDNSSAAKRAPYARHHFWVTGHRDGELWAAGEFTNQSCTETGGVQAMVDRGDWFTDKGELDRSDGEGRRSSPVVWAVFGLTHNPRIEDWPVMPAETHQVHLRPADFFTSNPALDVPSKKNEASVLLSCCNGKDESNMTTSNGVHVSRSVQDEPITHSQGQGPDLDPRVIGVAIDGEGTF